MSVDTGVKMYKLFWLNYTLKEWSDITGIPYKSLNIRIKHGWTVSEALLVPIGVNKDKYNIYQIPLWMKNYNKNKARIYINKMKKQERINSFLLRFNQLQDLGN
jgi:hypothetical protein